MRARSYNYGSPRCTYRHIVAPFLLFSSPIAISEFDPRPHMAPAYLSPSYPLFYHIYSIALLQLSHTSPELYFSPTIGLF